MSRHPTRRAALAGLGAAGLGWTALAGRAAAQGKPVTLLNVSYDPTRELYKEYDAVFCANWRRDRGQTVTVEQSHGGSGKQALSVINGLAADVVTLGISSDIDAIAQKAHLLSPDWAGRLPYGSTPYTSTVVFLVRAGNPKRIRDWGDLLHPGVQVITPNPKTSSGGRWNYAAAYLWALRAPGGSDAKARDYLGRLYAQVPVLDSGARGATTTFAQRGQGDVLLAWENEAVLAMEEMGPGKFELVIPSLSILAEPPVAVVDKVAAQKGATEVAAAYLRGLYTPRGQDIIARNHYRPRNPQVLARYAAKFPRVNMGRIGELGGWTRFQAAQFADGAAFDQIYRPH